MNTCKSGNFSPRMGGNASNKVLNLNDNADNSDMTLNFTLESGAAATRDIIVLLGTPMSLEDEIVSINHTKTYLADGTNPIATNFGNGDGQEMFNFLNKRILRQGLVIESIKITHADNATGRAQGSKKLQFVKLNMNTATAVETEGDFVDQSTDSLTVSLLKEPVLVSETNGVGILLIPGAKIDVSIRLGAKRVLQFSKA